MILCLLASLPGCKSSTASTGDMTMPDLAAHDALAIACSDSVDAVYQLPDGLPTYDASHRGDVIRCALDRGLPAAQINATLTALGYLGPPVTQDIHVYRIAFRTERVAPAAGGPAPEGVSSALVLLPVSPRPEAFVVTAHGTDGLAAKCVDSRKDLTVGTGVDDTKVFNLALAGDGWPVIAPDYAGFGYGQTPQGWSFAEDEAHSILDATRAMKNLLGDSAPAKVVLMGHSQGSHAVLAAQSFAKSYGMAGQLVGVAPMSLLWFSGQSWGASISLLAGLTTQNDAGALSYGLFYFYGHGELLDGPGGGLAMIQPAKRDQVKTLLENNCESDMSTAMPTLGRTSADFYDSSFIGALTDCMLLGNNCDVEPAKTWKARALADRPPIDPSSAPIAVWHGAQDTDIAPSRAQCGFDKISSDLAAATTSTTKLEICGDPNATHGSLIRRDIDWINQWIAARATGQPDPPGCLGAAPLQPGDGGTLTCATPPAND